MPDESSEKIVRLLEEIRDLTKERNAKLETLLQTTRQRADNTARRYAEAQERAIAQRRRFLWILSSLLLLTIAWVVYVFVWAIPQAEQKQVERELEETRMMQSNSFQNFPNR